MKNVFKIAMFVLFLFTTVFTFLYGLHSIFVTYDMALVFACTIMFLCSVSITTAIANS